MRPSVTAVSDPDLSVNAALHFAILRMDQRTRACGFNGTNKTIPPVCVIITDKISIYRQAARGAT
ncbi:Uncharacterised protein [Salmonella enterica subsp. enterica serovar Typhimurium]|nr:Uncharacterised protein [Salmonella enterica subsp. enterica serovar Typhimurium]